MDTKLGLADKQSMDAAFVAARFFLIANELHIVLKGEVPCGLPIPETFYDLKSASPQCDWGVCRVCHLAFLPTAFRTVSFNPSENGGSA